MRFEPWRCENCGETATGTVETVPGVALVLFDEEGNAEYAGETRISWNDQTSLIDVHGRVTLECPNGHQWQARATEMPDWKQ